VSYETRIAELESENKSLRAVAEALFAYGDENDFTADPWWAVVKKTHRNPPSVLAGPFFSRQQAEDARTARLHDYGPKSLTYCFSGYYSRPYRELRRMAKEALGLRRDA
jgi:hypothetical protein